MIKNQSIMSLFFIINTTVYNEIDARKTRLILGSLDQIFINE